MDSPRGFWWLGGAALIVSLCICLVTDLETGRSVAALLAVAGGDEAIDDLRYRLDSFDTPGALACL